MDGDRDKALIACRFDRRADSYESVTPVQSMMADRLMAIVADALPNANIPMSMLDMGCGPGRLARRFTETFPTADVLGIDVAPTMIDKARESLPSGRFSVADAETYLQQSRETFDVIASNAALQWFAHPVEALQRCLDRLKPGGLLAAATFGEETFRELRDSFGAAYVELGRDEAEHVHHLPSADYWRSALPGFLVRDETHELTFPSVREFLHSVRRAGATHSPTGPSSLTRSLYRAMTAHYSDRFSRPGGVVATYHAIYLTYTKPNGDA